jgi:hypothetical protein
LHLVLGLGADADSRRVSCTPARSKAERDDLMPRTPQTSQQKSWDIYQARLTPAKWIGTVQAVDADTAINDAAKEFNVEDTKKLLAVQW